MSSFPYSRENDSAAPILLTRRPTLRKLLLLVEVDEPQMDEEVVLFSTLSLLASTGQAAAEPEEQPPRNSGEGKKSETDQLMDIKLRERGDA